MSPSVAAWVTLLFDGVGVLVGLVAVLVYVVAYRQMRTIRDGVAIPVAVLRRWLLTNALFIGLVTLNMARWFTLNDLYPMLGKPSEVSSFDDLTWAVCDLLLVLMPLILISRVLSASAALRGDRG
jgi:hypothetical protein